MEILSLLLPFVHLEKLTEIAKRNINKEKSNSFFVHIAFIHFLSKEIFPPFVIENMLLFFVLCH